MFVSEQERRLVALRESLPGQVLAGSDGRRYPLGERIGDGGQGWIFRATWNGSVDVVVKVLRPDVVTTDTLARFQREAAVLRTMSHQPAPNPHIVRYYDHAQAKLLLPGTHDRWTLPFTVLEYVEGETLAHTLSREGGAGLGLERSRRILRHIVLALRDVHAQNIVHRDLKPSNVLIDTTGGRELAKVTDFGLAKVFQSDLHRTTALAGATVGYAPPEQFERGNTRVGRPTDIFSLASIFFEILTGEPAFPMDESAPPFLALHKLLQGNRPTFARITGKLPTEVRSRPDIVSALDDVLLRALAAEPGQRYPSVTDFHDAVESAFRPLGSGPTFALGDMPPSGAIRIAPRSVGDAATLLADDNTLRTSAPSFSTTPVSRADPGGEVSDAPRWQMTSPPVYQRPLRAIAVSPDSGHAVGVGADGLGVWNGRAWTRLDLPSDVAPESLQAVAWLGEHMVVAGASPVVRVRAPDRTFASFVFNLPGIAFHGAFADAMGVLLAGERATQTGPVGVLAMLNVRAGGALSLAWVDVPTTGPLRAVTRLERVVVACGDAGGLAVLQGGHLTATHVCAPPLLALLPSSDGELVAVGGGGFAFRVQRTLDVRLEAVQTTRTLWAVARGPDGALYCAGEDRRVLKATPSGWMRAGATVGVAGATIRGLVVAPERITGFCDDGSVLEGVIHAMPVVKGRTVRGTG